MKKAIMLFVAALLLASPVFAAPQGDGRKVVAVAGTAEAIAASTTPFTVVTMCAEADNTGVIAVGTDPVAALATREGVFLGPGDCYTIDRQYGDLSLVKIDTTVNGDGVTYDYQYR